MLLHFKDESWNMCKLSWVSRWEDSSYSRTPDEHEGWFLISSVILGLPAGCGACIKWVLWKYFDPWKVQIKRLK